MDPMDAGPDDPFLFPFITTASIDRRAELLDRDSFSRATVDGSGPATPVSLRPSVPTPRVSSMLS